MNYSDIDLILAIADAGSISVAADNLFVSQPFLSTALKRIEDKIGTLLFKRSKSGTILTPFGHEYVQYARHIADQTESLNSLYKTRQGPQLRLDVVSAGLNFLYPAIGRLRKKYCEDRCTFQLAEASTSQQIQMIAAGKYEVGVTLLRESNRRPTILALKDKGLEYIKLHDAKAGICVSKKSKLFPYSINQLNEETIRYLTAMPYVGLYTSPEDIYAFKACPEFNFLIQNQKTKTVCANAEMRTEIINQCDGFGTDVYCKALCKKYPHAEQMRFIPFASSLNLGVEVGWIQRQNQPRSPLANDLYDSLQE